MFVSLLTVFLASGDKVATRLMGLESDICTGQVQAL